MKKRKLAARQFEWGAPPLKMYQRRSKVSSNYSENNCRVQEQKLA